MKKKFNRIIASALVLLLFSCDVSYFDKDIEDFEWNGGAQLPIGHITYTLTDLFSELGVNDFTEDPNSNLSFSYEKSISAGSNEAFNVPIDDINITSSVSTSEKILDKLALLNKTSYTIQPGDDDLLTEETIKNQTIQVLNLSQELTAADFDAGLLKIDLSSSFDADVEITLTIPSITRKDNGKIYERVRVLTKADPSETVTANFELFNANFTHDGTGYNKTHNTIVVDVKAVFTFEAGHTIRTTDKISYTANISGATTNVVYGDFKQEPFNVNSESILLDFFDSFGDGSITFANPTMTLTAENKFGFPIGIDLNSIEAVNGSTTQKLTYNGTTADEISVPNNFIMDGIAAYSKTASAVTTTRVLNKDNSNIVQVLGIKPTSINLSVSGKANPVNKNPNINFYSKWVNGLDVSMKIEVPMEVKFENIELEQSIEFDDASDLDDLKDVTLFLTTENRIPLSGNLELEFYNGSQKINVSKTLAAFDAADVDGNGKSAGTKVKSSQLNMSDADIQKIKTATDIKVKIKLNTPSTAAAIKLVGSDSIKIYIGAKVEGEFGSN